MAAPAAVFLRPCSIMAFIGRISLTLSQKGSWSFNEHFRTVDDASSILVYTLETFG